MMSYITLCAAIRRNRPAGEPDVELRHKQPRNRLRNLTTLGNFSVSGVSGDGSDIFVCTPGSLGSTTACTWAMYWDGSANGFAGEVTDSMSIVP